MARYQTETNLRQRCDALNLSATGTRAELLARLRAHRAEQKNVRQPGADALHDLDPGNVESIEASDSSLNAEEAARLHSDSPATDIFPLENVTLGASATREPGPQRVQTGDVEEQLDQAAKVTQVFEPVTEDQHLEKVQIEVKGDAGSQVQRVGDEVQLEEAKAVQLASDSHAIEVQTLLSSQLEDHTTGQPEHKDAGNNLEAQADQAIVDVEAIETVLPAQARSEGDKINDHPYTTLVDPLFVTVARVSDRSSFVNDYEHVEEENWLFTSDTREQIFSPDTINGMKEAKLMKICQTRFTTAKQRHALMEKTAEVEQKHSREREVIELERDDTIATAKKEAIKEIGAVYRTLKNKGVEAGERDKLQLKIIELERNNSIARVTQDAVKKLAVVDTEAKGAFAVIENCDLHRKKTNFDSAFDQLTWLRSKRGLWTEVSDFIPGGSLNLNPLFSNPLPRVTEWVFDESSDQPKRKAAEIESEAPIFALEELRKRLKTAINSTKC